MCFTAIPGRTGLLVARDVAAPVKRKKAIQHTVAPSGQLAAVGNIGSRFYGGSREKKKKDRPLLLSHMRMNIRAQNAKQHSRVHPKHESLYREVRA